MYLAERAVPKSGPRSAPHGWLIVYLIFTVGELCLSPIGLSLVNKLAPAADRLADDGGLVPLHGGRPTTWRASLEHDRSSTISSNLWIFLICTSIVPGVILLALTPVLMKMGHGRI